MKLITDKELKAAERMARRKKGVTRAQLADKLGVSRGRAKSILDKTGAKAKVAGVSGRANRTLVFHLG